MWPLLTGFASAQSLAPTDYSALATDFAPTGPVTIDTDALTFDDGTGILDGEVDGGIAVFAFAGLTLDQPVTIVGTRPLALLSTGDLTVDTPLRLDGSGRVPGSGGYESRETNSRGDGPGGGAGNMGAGGGGHGGAGGDAHDSPGSGGIVNGDLTTWLRGGSAGGTPRGSPFNAGDGGSGGGALLLGSIGRLEVNAALSARGSNADDGDRDGGGGGSGGAIVLAGGPTSVCLSTLDVSGGTGGDAGAWNSGGGGGGGRIWLTGTATLGCTLLADGGAGGTGGDGPGEAGGMGVIDIAPGVDADGDGFDDTNGGDCDDADPNRYPGAPELCDGLDQDCDGAVDEDAADLQWWPDLDADGFGDPGVPFVEACIAPAQHDTNADYCDDDEADMNPDAVETCDGLDNDCDGRYDDDDDDTADLLPTFADLDQDGFGDPNAPIWACPQELIDITDCDDSDAHVNPAERELADDGVDNDCDGVDAVYRYGNGCTTATSRWSLARWVRALSRRR